MGLKFNRIGKSKLKLTRHSAKLAQGTNCCKLGESLFTRFPSEDWLVNMKSANTKFDDFILSVIIKIRLYHSWSFLARYLPPLNSLISFKIFHFNDKFLDFLGFPSKSSRKLQRQLMQNLYLASSDETENVYKSGATRKQKMKALYTHFAENFKLCCSVLSSFNL